MFGEGVNFPALSVFAGAVCAMMLSRNSRYTDARIPFIAGSMFYYVIANECPVHNLVHTALCFLSAAGSRRSSSPVSVVSTPRRPW